MLTHVARFIKSYNFVAVINDTITTELYEKQTEYEYQHFGHLPKMSECYP